MTAQAQDDDANDPQVVDTIPLPTEQRSVASSEEPVELETYVVLGEKLGRTLDETASSVRVLTGEDLSEHGDEDAFDALSRVANATANSNGQFTLRGINSTGVDGSEFGRQTASIYVDGVALDRVGLQTGATEGFDVDRVEVLRGNQSTSQGRNALAGGIVVETRDPTQYNEVHSRLQGAEAGLYEAGVAGGGPIGDTTAFRLVAHTRNDDGEVTNTTLNDPEWQREITQTARGKFAWRPTDFMGVGDLDAVISVQRAESERGESSFGNFESYAGAPQNRRTSTSNTPDIHLRNSTLSSLQFSLDTAPDRQWVSTTSAQFSDEWFRRDADYNDSQNNIFEAESDGLTATQELRYQFQDWRGLTGLVGLYGAYFNIEYNGTSTDFPIGVNSVIPGAPGEVLVDLLFGSTGEQINGALFAEADYTITDRLTATFGLRYDYEQSTTSILLQVTRADLQTCSDEAAPVLDAIGIDNCTPGVSVLVPLQQSGVIPGSDGDLARADYDAVLPKFGLRFAATDNVTVFGLASLGYRAGGAEALVTTGEIKEFEPETTYNFETGLRTQWWDNRLGLDLNLFYTRWRDQQVQMLTEDRSDSFTANAAESELYGLELEGRLRIGFGLSSYASLGLVDTEFKDYVNGDEDLSGNEFGRAPDTTASAGFVWRPSFLPVSGLFLSSSVSYTASSFAFPNNDVRERSDARTLWDARVGYDGRRFSTYLFGLNLLDEDYATFRIYDPPMSSNPEEGQRVIYGPLRRLGVRFEARF